MSIEDMIAEEPPAFVCLQKNPLAANVAGMPLHDLTKAGIGPVAGRLDSPSAFQKEAWKTQMIEAKYTFITLEAGIPNGAFVRVDDRLFRVVGERDKTYGKGSIPNYWCYPLEEESMGGPTQP